MPTINFIIGAVGVLASAAFIMFNIQSSRMPDNILPKRYYNWMTAAGLIFAFGFATEFLNLVIENEVFVENLHHIFLIAAGVVFVITSSDLAEEIRRKKQN